MDTKQQEAASLLNAAISAGDIGKVEDLLKEGISAHGPDHLGQLPMFVAARDGKTDIAEALIEHGVDVNAPVDRNGRRPIYCAASNGHVDFVRMLIADGATIDVVDSYGLSALYLAALGLANEILNVPDQALWRKTQSSNPTGHVAIAEMLILAGADIRLAPKGNYTPEHFIRVAAIPRLITLLKERAETAPKRSLFSGLFGS